MAPPTPPTSKSIFLTYAAADLDLARETHEALVGAGWSCWFDVVETRQESDLSVVRSRIAAGLSGAAAAVVVLTQAYLDRPWTQFEFAEMTGPSTTPPRPTFFVHRGLADAVVNEWIVRAGAMSGWWFPVPQAFRDDDLVGLVARLERARTERPSRFSSDPLGVGIDAVPSPLPRPPRNLAEEVMARFTQWSQTLAAAHTTVATVVAVSMGISRPQGPRLAALDRSAALLRELLASPLPLVTIDGVERSIDRGVVVQLLRRTSFDGCRLGPTDRSQHGRVLVKLLDVLEERARLLSQEVLDGGDPNDVVATRCEVVTVAAAMRDLGPGAELVWAKAVGRLAKDAPPLAAPFLPEAVRLAADAATDDAGLMEGLFVSWSVALAPRCPWASRVASACAFGWNARRPRGGPYGWAAELDLAVHACLRAAQAVAPSDPDLAYAFARHAGDRLGALVADLPDAAVFDTARRGIVAAVASLGTRGRATPELDASSLPCLVGSLLGGEALDPADGAGLLGRVLSGCGRPSEAVSEALAGLLASPPGPSAADDTRRLGVLLADCAPGPHDMAHGIQVAILSGLAERGGPTARRRGALLARLGVAQSLRDCPGEDAMFNTLAQALVRLDDPTVVR